jgi:hypothetical protein
MPCDYTFTARCWNPFYCIVNALISSVTQSHLLPDSYTIKFPLLRQLSTNICDDWLRELLSAYPGIEQLALLPRHTQGAITMLSHQPWLLPNLKRLRISDCAPVAKCILETSRAWVNGHIPLQLIEIRRMEFSSLFFEAKIRELENTPGRTSWYYPDSDEGPGLRHRRRRL